MKSVSKALLALAAAVLGMLLLAGCSGAQGWPGPVPSLAQEGDSAQFVAEHISPEPQPGGVPKQSSPPAEPYPEGDSATPSPAGRYQQHDPTLEEVLEFLKDDQTDAQRYEGDYACAHFARDVNNAAESQGLRCAVVLVRFPNRYHAIVGFATVDAGMVYFEPQTDERVYPVIGKEFWRCVAPEAGFYYQKPPYDDTIVELLTIW